MSLEFKEFLELTKGYDREFLRGDEIYKIPEIFCAFANSNGGIVIIGAEIDENGEINITGIDGKIDLSLIRSHEFQIFKTPEKIIAVKIESLKRNEPPLNFNGKIYRRFEGENFISNLKSSSIMALDSFESSRDDFALMNAPIDSESLNDFHKTVTKINETYKNFKHGEFLSRSYIFSGKYLTFAGALMFSNILNIKAELNYSFGHAEVEEFNIWNACKNILPRLERKLSEKCASALREIFVNAVLHSDYNIDNKIYISITSDPPKISITNPGILRYGMTRNKRLEKILTLSGILTGKGKGLEIVKRYSPDFKLQQNMLDFKVTASIEIEGSSLPDPVML